MTAASLAHSPAPSAPTEGAVRRKLILAAMLWGGGFSAGRVAAESFTPLGAAAARYALAAAILLWLARRAHGVLPRLSLRQAAQTLVLGATGVFAYNLFFFAALARMPASRTALFVALSPVAVALVGALWTRERLGARKWAGILAALVGAAILASRGAPGAMLADVAASFGAGELFMLGAVAAWAAYTMVGRAALTGLTPLTATAYAAAWGFALLAATLALSGAPALVGAPGAAAWLTVLFLAVGATVVPFVWYYEGVRALGPTRAAAFGNLVPFFGVLFGVVLLGESLTPAMLAGGAMIVLGVWQTTRPPR
ncbi:DMT family transporter [Oceanicella actignis]|uniref:DMT family transporter n=1 Tax=Oceanicella actignis TaxID=1189325 RepID=UPI0011E7BF57|nr:DMT family transporter [Oceanicella actignis]TYO89123.1 threonine/homoserine efflux transporter RhtA [Oceanicella actignis]